MLRGTTGMLAALLLALPLAHGAEASSYCGCTKIWWDGYKDAEIQHTGVSRGTQYCEDKTTKTCYFAPPNTSSCVTEGNTRCSYSVACANALKAGKACQKKYFRIRFTKGKNLISDSVLRDIRSDLKQALNDKLNPGYVNVYDLNNDEDKLANYEKLNFVLDVDTYPRQKSGYTKSTGRRLLEEDAIELDLFDDEEDVEIIPRRRRLAYTRRTSRNASPTKKPNSMKSKYKQYTYVKVEIQGPWLDKASINQKEIETFITTQTKKMMNCCKAVTFYKICEGLNCKSTECDEGSECKKDSSSGGSAVVLIVIVVLVVCCCCCAAAVGAYFYMNQKNENLNKELETQTENSTPRGEEGAGGPNSTNAVTQGAPEEAI